MNFLNFRQLALLSLLIYAPLSQAASSCLGGASTSFRLGGAVTYPKTFTLASLEKYQTSKMTVSFFSGASGLVTTTYIGVPLYDLITEASVITDSTHKNDLLRKYLVMNATDCYQVLVSLAEILPATGGQQAMVAFATVDATGAVIPLDATEGAMKLIMPGDKAGGRDMYHLSSIIVHSL
jgi:hypothetical protein